MVPRALSLTRCGLSRRTVRPWKAVIFDASNASSIDSTAMQALEEAHEFLQSVDIAFYIANPNRCAHCVPVLLICACGIQPDPHPSLCSAIAQKLQLSHYKGIITHTVHRAVQIISQGRWQQTANSMKVLQHAMESMQAGQPTITSPHAFPPALTNGEEFTDPRTLDDGHGGDAGGGNGDGSGDAGDGGDAGAAQTSGGNSPASSRHDTSQSPGSANGGTVDGDGDADSNVRPRVAPLEVVVGTAAQ